MTLKPLSNDETDHLDIDASVQAALAACGGDAIAALRAMIVMNSYLDAEADVISSNVSKGFARGKRRAFSAKTKDVLERHLLALEIAIEDGARHIGQRCAGIVEFERAGRSVVSLEATLTTLNQHQARQMEYLGFLRQLTAESPAID